MESIQVPRMLIVGDIHAADNPPSSRKDTYREDILDKLKWIISYTNEQEVEYLLLLGDVFHIKRPDRNSHALVQDVATILGEFEGSKVLVQIGNHDLMRDRVDSLPSQPLGTLGLHPKIEILNGPSAFAEGVYSVPYFDPTPENFKYWADKYMEDGGPKKYPFVSAHQALFPKKEEPIYDYISTEEWAKVFGNKWTAYGHIHSRMKAGAFFKSEGSWFCNNGAISRGSLHEETIHRKLAVTMFDPSKEDEPFVSIPIPFKPPSEVFNLEAVEVLKDRQNAADEFLESLGSSELQYLTVEGIMEEARSSKSLSKEALQELEDIIQTIATD